MPYPPGRPRGPMLPSHKANLGSAVSAGQRRRFADPEERRKHAEVHRECWATGSRAEDRLVWTDEMDAKLRVLCEIHPYRVVRLISTEQIGVGEKSTLRRIKTLGLQCRKTQSMSERALAREIIKAELLVRAMRRAEKGVE